jgi:hypothetical protein
MAAAEQITYHLGRGFSVINEAGVGTVPFRPEKNQKTCRKLLWSRRSGQGGEGIARMLWVPAINIAG